MNRQRWWWLAGGLVLALGIAGVLWRGRTGAPDAPAGAGGPTVAAGETTGEPIPVDLYFPGRGSRLAVERRLLRAGGDPESRIRAIVALLQQGPEDPALRAPLPAGLELLAVYLGDDGVAYLDFALTQEAAGLPSTGPAGSEPLPAYGSTQELQAVYSLVNSVVTNLPEVGWVVLLWNGMQRPTFAGHLDTSRPLAANLDLVETRP